MPLTLLVQSQVIDYIMHSRKSLLLSKNEIWIKKKDNPNFDVPMRSFDRAELCELVGLYLLNILKSEFGGKNLDYAETMVSAVLKISLDLSWKKSKRTYVKFLKITVRTS